jgi:hypothetical protein
LILNKILRRHMLNHFKSKTLIALIVAGLSLSAVAEEKDTGKKDDEDKK